MARLSFGQLSQRGNIVLVALPGDYGKPRPALIVQADAAGDLPSVVVCPLTTTIRDDLTAFRLTIEPSSLNGLQAPSQVMMEKPVAIPRTRVRDTIGQLDDRQMLAVTAAIAVLLDIV